MRIQQINQNHKMDTKLEEVRQMELKFRNKIIQLQKQLEYQNLRANQYEAKFKEAVMSNSTRKEDQQLLSKLMEKQQQISQLRKQLLDVNRKLNESKNNNEDVEELQRQNIEMRNVVEQLKNAAIAAIMEKDAELQQMKSQINEIDLVQHVAQLQEKNHQLEENLKAKTMEYEQEIKVLNEKLSYQRDGFSQKLTLLHRQFSHQQNQKQKLLQKAQSLEGNLQDLQKVIQKYEAKLGQAQNIRSSQKITATKNEHQMQRRINNLLDDIKNMEKNENSLQQKINSLNKTIEEQKKKMDSICEEKEQLDRKLKIKNRKTNAKENSKSIYESFEGISQKANVFASFVRKQTRDLTKQSFVGEPIKLSDIKQMQIEEIQNFSEYIHDPNQIINVKRKYSDSIQNAKSVTTNGSTQNQTYTSGIRVKSQKIQELQNKIQLLLNEIEECNKTISDMTKQLQKQRQDKLELKQKHSTSESEYVVEKQSLRQHVYKLENALLIQKLQNAEKLESNKEIREYQKKIYEDQIKKLKMEIESSKKKKGFFG